MDFTNYPSILAKANELGGIKQGMFNKKLMAKADSIWMSFTPEEMMQIEYEAGTAVKVLTTFVTPSIIMVMNKGSHVLYPIPVRDIIWIYGYVLKNSMNFIPTDKQHTVNIMTRDGEIHQVGPFSTLALSKKDITGDAIKQIREVIFPYRKGILYGYTDYMAQMVQENLQAVVQEVDARSYQ